MSRVCVLFAEGFEEIEAITIVDVLRRAGIETVAVAVGTPTLSVRGAHAIAIEADRTLAEAARETWDLVVLPGGLPGATNLRDSAEVQSLLRAQNESGRQIAAICAAPIALGAAGVLEGRRATCYPGFEKELDGARPVEDRVVSDGHVTTSRGPGTALEFSLHLVERLGDAKTAAKLRAGMLVAT